MEAKLVGEELSKCRKGEGVNSYQNCKHLADLYLELLRDASVSILILSVFPLFSLPGIYVTDWDALGQGLQASYCE